MKGRDRQDGREGVESREEIEVGNRTEAAPYQLGSCGDGTMQTRQDCSAGEVGGRRDGVGCRGVHATGRQCCMGRLLTPCQPDHPILTQALACHVCNMCTQRSWANGSFVMVTTTN